MVPQTPQSEDGGLDMRQDAGLPRSSKQLVKETHREGHNAGILGQSNKEGQAASKARDVAELKDYV